MKVTAGRAEGFVRAPPDTISAFLLFGPDGGMVRERAERLAKRVVPDLSDPFAVTELLMKDLKDDPARLVDEVAAMSLTGGARVIRVRDGVDGLAGAAEDAIAAARSDAVLVVEAGDLPTRSKLRKLFESDDGAAAIGCYADDASSLGELVRSIFSERGIEASPDAVAYLTDHLGSDRAVSRQELEKLALYAGDGGKVSLEDAIACVGDSAAMAIDDIINAAGTGDTEKLSRALANAFAEGSSAVGIVRASIRRFQRLEVARTAVDGGTSIDAAVKGLRPPIFFKMVGPFKAQLGVWNAPDLARALDVLTDCEIACKTTGTPAETACGHALMRLAQRARQARRRQRR